MTKEQRGTLLGWTKFFKFLWTKLALALPCSRHCGTQSPQIQFCFAFTPSLTVKVDKCLLNLPHHSVTAWWCFWQRRMLLHGIMTTSRSVFSFYRS